MCVSISVSLFPAGGVCQMGGLTPNDGDIGRYLGHDIQTQHVGT